MSSRSCFVKYIAGCIRKKVIEKCSTGSLETFHETSNLRRLGGASPLNIEENEMNSVFRHSVKGVPKTDFFSSVN